VILLVALISFASPLYHCSMISLAVALCHRTSILIFFSIHFHKTNGKHAESSQHEMLLLLTFVFYHHFFKIIVLCVPGGKKGQYLLSLLIEHASIYIFIIFAILWQVNLLRMQVPFVFSYLLEKKSCCCWIGMLRLYTHTQLYGHGWNGLSFLWS